MLSIPARTEARLARGMETILLNVAANTTMQENGRINAARGLPNRNEPIYLLDQICEFSQAQKQEGLATLEREMPC